MSPLRVSRAARLPSRATSRVGCLHILSGNVQRCDARKRSQPLRFARDTTPKRGRGTDAGHHAGRTHAASRITMSGGVRAPARTPKTCLGSSRKRSQGGGRSRIATNAIPSLPAPGSHHARERNTGRGGRWPRRTFLRNVPAIAGDYSAARLFSTPTGHSAQRSVNAAHNRSMSASLCSGVGVNRRRSVPLGTVG